MIRIQLTLAEKEKVHQLPYSHPQSRVQQRTEVLHLVNQGVILKRVAGLCNLSQNTITIYIIL